MFSFKKGDRGKLVVVAIAIVVSEVVYQEVVLTTMLVVGASSSFALDVVVVIGTFESWSVAYEVLGSVDSMILWVVSLESMVLQDSSPSTVVRFKTCSNSYDVCSVVCQSNVSVVEM